MDRKNTFVLGIDLGTQGVRTIITNLQGEVVAEEKKSLCSSYRTETIFEQNPEEWIEKIDICVSRLLQKFFALSYPRESLVALSCDSTSGTVVAVDGKGNPLGPAIMYNDARAQEEAVLVNEAGKDFCQKMGYRFDPSFALCKVLWMKQKKPNIFEKTKYFLHAADFVVGVLTGEWGISDISNALKMGYNLVDWGWPDFIESKLHIPITKLPRVHTTGTIVGKLHSFWTEKWRCIPLWVVAGATDGTASFYASGVEQAGDISSTLGTTLVIRSISEHQVKDPQGRVYCHRHPDKLWLPGGASNTGGECLNHFFPGIDLSEWDRMVQRLSLPTELLVYPLIRQGERLPFANPKARFFKIGEEKEPLEFYAACLEGVGYIERYSFELLEELGANPIQRVFASGSGAKSLVWNQIRANIFHRPIKLPANLDSAMGSCIIAAAPLFGELRCAGKEMVKIVATIDPELEATLRYEEKYQAFREECQKRGYE
ncbi:MAG: FGGY-family carbohydrate kinase [Candidatus Caldatribacteriaceae bacterium]